MKEVLSLATLAIGVQSFVTFVTTVKPTAINAVQWANKPDHCLTELSSQVLAKAPSADGNCPQVSRLSTTLS